MTVDVYTRTSCSLWLDVLLVLLYKKFYGIAFKDRFSFVPHRTLVPFSECKSTHFFTSRQIFSEIFLSRKKSRLGNARPFALVLKWLRRTTAACFFSRFSSGADCKLRHFTPTRQIFSRKSFGIMLHNMLWRLKSGRRRLELGIAVRRRAAESGQRAAVEDGWRHGQRGQRERRTGNPLPMDYSLLCIRVRARALRVLHLGFYRKLYTGEDKILTHSGMRVKGWGVKLYTNCSPSLFPILLNRFFS